MTLCYSGTLPSRSHISSSKSESFHILLRISFLLCIGVMLMVVLNLDRFLWPAESYFQSPMTSSERDNMFEVLEDFHKALEKANVSYFMGGGTLIGSVRHHGPVPWDDDIDVVFNPLDIYVKSAHKKRLRNAMANLQPRYSLYGQDPLEDQSPTQMWKFFRPGSGRKFLHRPFTWPYVDIFFYLENSSHIWDEVGWYKYARQQIFPLIRRPFGKFWLPAPCNSSYALNSYKIQLCQTRSFSHLMEVPIIMSRQRIIECSRLVNRFPFVFREELVNLTSKSGQTIVVKEALNMNSLNLQIVKIFEPPCTGIDRTDNTNLYINKKKNLIH